MNVIRRKRALVIAAGTGIRSGKAIADKGPSLIKVPAFGWVVRVAGQTGPATTKCVAQVGGAIRALVRDVAAAAATAHACPRGYTSPAVSKAGAIPARQA